MTSDATGATIDGAENTTVGKGNVQQVVNVGRDEAHRDAENTHVITVRLLNDWLGSFEARMDRESEERRQSLDEVRSDLNELKNIVHGMASKFGYTIRLPYGHMQIFVMAFAMLWIPTPMFLSDVRAIIGVSWTFVVLFTALAYTVSAALWGYLWFGGGRS